jgi:threonine-phosphate decarboxylase
MRKPLQNTAAVTATHGGKVYAAARRLGVHVDEIIDFSSNINPMGVPPGVLAAIENSLRPAPLCAYPDAHAFVSAVADKHDLTPEAVIVGNGSAALMFAVLRALLPARVMILEPAFDEYFRACIAVKAAVKRLPLAEENGFAPDFTSLAGYIKERQPDLLILNSPHNPTGALYAREDLSALVELAEANQVAVMLDEAFIDYAPQSSLLRVAAQKSRFIVLRSLTKFYAMPGLRIGYAVCGPELAAAVRQQIEAWPVSTVALDAGRAALGEDTYESKARDVNAQSREEFAEALRGIRLSVFPSAANFLLARLPGSSGTELARWLEHERVLIRQCDSFRGLGDQYIRLAVRSRQDNLKLVAMVAAWLKRNEP